MATGLPGDLHVLREPDPPTATCVDIVATRGIGIISQSWSEAVTNQTWLRDLLPREVPSARIMVYFYNPELLLKSGVDEPASNLLLELGKIRQQDKGRPLTFVCHGLGSIIVQKALLRAQMDSRLARLRWATIGVIFVLTPHSEHPIDWNNVISNPSGKPAASQSTTDQSRKWQVSETFAKINYNFQHVAASLKIIRICTDDCEASCENNQGTSYLSQNSSHIQVLSPKGRHYTISNLDSATDLSRLLGYSIALVLDVLKTQYQNGYEKLALRFPGEALWHPGTCQWLLASPEYHNWRKGRDSAVFWLQGRAGSGKTTLASYTLEQLRANISHNETQVAYFYIPGTTSSLAKSLLESILLQLWNQNSQGYDKAQLHRVLATINHGSPPLSAQGFGQHLRTVLSSLPSNAKLILILDGLDDCDGLVNQIAKEVIRINFITKESKHVRCLITSRSDCSSQLTDNHASKVSLNENRFVQLDMSLVIKDKCEELSARFPSHQKTLRCLASRLIRQSQASFLWISLVLHDVSRRLYLKEPNFSSPIIRMPSQINRIYQQQLESISEQHRTMSSKIFTFLAYAVRPLRLDELSAALSAPLSKASDSEPIVSKDFILDYCGGLVVVNEEQVAEFFHHSIRDFLTSEDNRVLLGPYFVDRVQAHRLLAHACLRCLLEHQQQRPSPLDCKDSSSNCLCRRETAAFEPYSSTHWSLHYRIAESHDSYLAGMFQELLDISVESRRGCIKGSSLPKRVIACASSSQNTIFRICAQTGSTILGKICLEMGIDVNTKFGAYGVSALHIAARRGHANMVKLLLKSGASVDARTSMHEESAVHATCCRDSRLVETLLEQGTHLDLTTGGYAETPLHMAVVGGHLEVIELLLTSGADVNAATSLTNETPLHLTAAFGFVGAADGLIGGRRHGSSDSESRRPSLDSAGARMLQGVARPNDNRRPGCTPISSSLSISDTTDIESVLDSGYDSRYIQSADIGARNCDGWTPLHVAAAWGSQDIVELLLERGAKVDPVTLDGWTALSLAVDYGHKAIASLLVTHSFDIDLERNLGWASLLLAAENDQFSFEKPFHTGLRSDDTAIDLLLEEKVEAEPLESHEGWTVINSPSNGQKRSKFG